MLNKVQTEAIVKHLREIADVLDLSCKNNIVKVVKEDDIQKGSKRGRKPGAVSDDIRCQHINEKNERCKNRGTKGNMCGKHDTV
jgi:hypothetical protein